MITTTQTTPRTATAGTYPTSIGDRQAEIALRACRLSATPPRTDATGLACPHCAAEMSPVEDLWIGASLLLSAKCPRCGCLRATYLEPMSGAFAERAQEASFD